MSREQIQREWNSRQVDAGMLSGDVLAELVRRGALEVQDELDLASDGLAGPATIEAVEELLGIDIAAEPTPAINSPREIPIPGPRGVDAVYGSFSFKSHPTQKGAIVIDRDWVRANIVKVQIPHVNRHTWMHKLAADDFRVTFARAVEAAGCEYVPERVWSWVARRKLWRNDRRPSMHAYGIAVDIDPHLNKYGTTSGPLYDHPEFVEAFEAAGWSWGGRWRTPDPQHFERVKR